MFSGRILYAVHNGTYVIKLCGDVRVPMCTSLDNFLDEMFQDSALNSVLVDLTETITIDSTALGLVAKIAVFLRDRLDRKPVILSTNPDVNRVLYSMGFDQVFIILESAVRDDRRLDELPEVEHSQDELTCSVIEAHRVLMSLNEQNEETFKDLVAALELERQSHSDCKHD